MRRGLGDNALALAIAAGLLVIGIYVQFRIIHECGWLAFVHGAEWLWMFGYCQQ